MGAFDGDALRAEIVARWERAAVGWGKHAQRMREFGMPVSVWMIEHARVQPGQRVLELAAGPGDTGFLAAELIRPGGTLISTDAAEPMLEVARTRAAEMGIENVEFKRMDLEWIDLETASVDVVLCKWGLMLSVDPEASLRETRRVLRPGGRIAVAVWDEPAVNPWATIPTRALVELGHIAPPDRDGPGMFALATPGRMQELLESAGFLDVVVDTVDRSRSYSPVEDFVTATGRLERLRRGLPGVARRGAPRGGAEDRRVRRAVHRRGRLGPSVGRTLVAAADA